MAGWGVGERRVVVRKIDAKFVCVEQVASESAIKLVSSGQGRVWRRVGVVFEGGRFQPSITTGNENASANARPRPR